ncbi:hypothetical protein FBU30_001335, partial [Linnemannia zychae]
MNDISSTVHIIIDLSVLDGRVRDSYDCVLDTKGSGLTKVCEFRIAHIRGKKPADCGNRLVVTVSYDYNWSSDL